MKKRTGQKLPKNSVVKIRLLRRRDWPEWARLRKVLWPDCAGPRAALEMRELSRNRGKFGVIVLDRGDGTLGGFVELALRDGVDGVARETTAFLEGWLVETDLRGNGWGRRLIRAAEQWAVDRGMVELASDTELDNRAGIAAHRALGFRETFRVVQFLKRVKRRGGLA
jgi:aminoglycoside 6'-N-acetyltransferase I